jgi:DNA repair protein RadC
MVIQIKGKNKRLVNPRDVWVIAQDLLNAEDDIDQDKEHFWVFHLDSRNTIKFIELVSLGTLNGALVSPREVYTRAVSERTAQIVVCHNHPTGVTEPSEDDISLTNRLKQAGDILSIDLVDHIIISGRGFTSLKEKGVL